MTRPRLLDLYCCAGGASMGYHRAGFEVIEQLMAAVRADRVAAA